MARRVNQVQALGVSVFRFVVEANAFRLDGDAALALEVHGVEHLLVHFALRKRAGHFEQTIRERGLTVIDVCDDTKIAYELWIHECSVPAGASHARNLRRTQRKTAPCNHSVCHKTK